MYFIFYWPTRQLQFLESKFSTFFQKFILGNFYFITSSIELYGYRNLVLQKTGLKSFKTSPTGYIGFYWFFNFTVLDTSVLTSYSFLMKTYIRLYYKLGRRFLQGLHGRGKHFKFWVDQAIVLMSTLKKRLNDARTGLKFSNF